MWEHHPQFLVSCLLLANPRIPARNISWLIEGKTYSVDRNSTHHHWFEPINNGSGVRILISLDKTLFSRVVTRRYLTLKVKGPVATVIKRIQVNYYYGPLLECPDLHIVKAGITEYNISCDIISSPVIPESNISWEFPSRTQHSTLPER